MAAITGTLRRAPGWAAVFVVGLIGGMMLVQPGSAAPPSPVPAPDMPVVEQNLDSSGHIAVHEQGTANVNVTGGNMTVGGTVAATQSGTWSVGVSNFPSVQPVSGTVNVGNFPATQNVNVTNSSIPVTGTVQVGNTSSSPVLVQQVAGPSRTPLALAGPNTSYTVPAGKRLVIESYTAFAVGTAPTLFDPNLEVTTGGTWVRHHLGVNRVDYVVSGVTTNYYSASNQIRLYADAGSTVHLNANFAAVTQRSITISGYLEDAS